MPPFVIGLAVGAGAQFADVYLKNAFHNHHDLIDITWVDFAVVGAALYFSPKGSAFGVLAGFALAVWLQGQLVTASTPGTVSVPVAKPPAVTSTPGGSAKVTNAPPSFTSVVFSGGGAGQP